MLTTCLFLPEVFTVWSLTCSRNQRVATLLQVKVGRQEGLGLICLHPPLSRKHRGWAIPALACKRAESSEPESCLSPMKRDDTQRLTSRGKESLNLAEYKFLSPTLDPKVGEIFLLLMTFVSGKKKEQISVGRKNRLCHAPHGAV